MAITVKEVAEAALKLLGHVNQQGTVDANRESRYLNVSPAFCEPLQQELLNCEGYTEDVDELTALTDILTVSDKTARTAMRYGLARDFCGLDSDDRYNTFSVLYENAKERIQPEPIEITDVYSAITDPDLTNGG